MMNGPSVGGRAAGCFIVLLCYSAALWAQPAAKHRDVLDNGLVLLHKQNPAALTLAVCCFIRVSALVENRSTAGLRNLAQQTLLDLPDSSGRRLEERLAERGISLRVQTTPDYVETVFAGTTDQFPQLLSAVHEIFGPAQPTPRQLTLRRTRILRELANRRELPLPFAWDTATAYLYRDTPCGWPVEGAGTVAGILPEQLQALRAMRYAPNRAVVSISGNISWAQAREETNRALGGLLPRPVPPEPAYRARLLKPAYLFSQWRGDNAAVLFATACPGPAKPEFAPTAVLNAVLSAGEGSRLFRVLRDREGLTYDIVSELVPSALCGMVVSGATCEPKQAAQVFHIMQAELAALKTRPPDEAEIQRAKAYLSSSFILGHQRNAEVAHYQGLFELLAPQHPEANLADALQAVTTEQVLAATAWLQDCAVWVQVGGSQP
ncbi:MAG: pitrilysin family protein [Armatimonadia bacterium]